MYQSVLHAHVIDIIIYFIACSDLVHKYVFVKTCAQSQMCTFQYNKMVKACYKEHKKYLIDGSQHMV